MILKKTGFHSGINREQGAWDSHPQSFLLKIQTLICWCLKEIPTTLHMSFILSMHFAGTLFLCHRHDTLSSSPSYVQSTKTILFLPSVSTRHVRSEDSTGGLPQPFIILVLHRSCSPLHAQLCLWPPVVLPLLSNHRDEGR